MAPYHLRILYGPWSGCGPVTFQLPKLKGHQCQAKVSSRGLHWDKIITGQCNISRMKLSQSVLGLSSQSCSSGSGSISLGPGWLVGKSDWELNENRPAKELITSQGNGMRASSEVELSRYWEMTSWICRGKYALLGLVLFGGHPNQLQRSPLHCPWSAIFKKVHHVGGNMPYSVWFGGHPNQLHRS